MVLEQVEIIVPCQECMCDNKKEKVGTVRPSDISAIRIIIEYMTRPSRLQSSVSQFVDTNKHTFGFVIGGHAMLVLQWL